MMAYFYFLGSYLFEFSSNNNFYFCIFIIVLSSTPVACLIFLLHLSPAVDEECVVTFTRNLRHLHLADVNRSHRQQL
jgi:hypothetical protein